MTTEPPLDTARSAEEPGEVLATTQLQVRALGLTGALMQNITAIAPAITTFFFTATIVGFTGAIWGGRVLLAAPAQRVQLAAALHLPSRDVRGADLLADQIVQPVPGLAQQLVTVHRRHLDADRRRHPGHPEAARRRDLAAQSG